MSNQRVWDDIEITSFKDILKAVGQEGSEALFIDPVDPLIDDAIRYLREQGLEWSKADGVDNFFFRIMIELSKLSVQLGYGLGLTRSELHLSSFDEWLEAAIVAGGLAGYHIDLDYIGSGRPEEDDKKEQLQ